MKIGIRIYCFLILSTFLFQPAALFPSQKPKSNIAKTNKAESKYSKFNINNISTFIYNDGNCDIRKDGYAGFEFPRGGNKTTIYESGFLWGGIIDGEIRIGGSTYEQGLQGGAILQNGNTQDPNDLNVRVFRVRLDYKTSDLSKEIEDEGLSYQELFSNYQKDWDEWPADLGAPYADLDNDGVFNPNIDIPGIPGANQTLWYVANDRDTGNTRTLYGSDPIKAELQVTVWGYSTNDHYNNIIFKKYKLINKSNDILKDAYFTIWSDIDVGSAADDCMGVDTLLNLMYAYNSSIYDEGYFDWQTNERMTQYKLLVPAVGFQVLESPYSDHSIGNKMRYINSFYTEIPSTYLGSDERLFYIEIYNIMHGLYRFTGSPFLLPDELGGGYTHFMFSGNPITGDGWNYKQTLEPADIKGWLSSGPFEINPGESKEIVFAQIAALGKDYLNSVAYLKSYADLLQSDYPNLPDKLADSRIDSIIINLDQSEYKPYDKIEFILSGVNEEKDKKYGQYQFEGIKFYQMADSTKLTSSGINVSTYDVKNEITEIYGKSFNPLTGYVKDDVIFKGTNSGIPSKITIERDYLNDTEFLKGKKYYFGISSVYFDKVSNSLIETDIKPYPIIFQSDLPGTNYMDVIPFSTLSGISDADVITEIVNPYELTGDTYEVSFGEQHYYLDENGNWIKTNYSDSIGKVLSKPLDQGLSTIIPLPSVYGLNNTLYLHFQFISNAPDFNNASAIILTFPEGISINNLKPDDKNYMPQTIEGQTVIWGLRARTAAGAFSGGEDLIVNINYTEPIFTVDYEIFDDGWSEFYIDATNDSTHFNMGNGTVDGTGSVTLTGEIAYEFKTEKYWDLFNKTQNIFALEYQTILSGYDINSGEKSEYGFEPVIDGFRIKINGSFDSPTEFKELILTSPTGLSSLSTNYYYDSTGISISNYSVFGGVENSLALSNFGIGTDDAIQLLPEIELRFTGVFDDGTEINGQTVYQIVEGGQLATCFRMIGNGQLANHPLNPNPEVDEPFLMRIPFEVWNVEDRNNEFQINFSFRDRMRYGNEDPFWSWSMEDRMYGIIVNSPYDSTQIIQIDDGPDDFNKYATWALVFWRTHYHPDDTVKIIYSNPIQLTDKFSFTTPKAPMDKISPNRYQVFQNYPNPFNPNTTIRYFIPEDGSVNLSVFNVLGQKVATLINKEMKAGKYETEFNGSNLASGVYIYRIDAGKFTETKKMLLLK